MIRNLFKATTVVLSPAVQWILLTVGLLVLSTLAYYRIQAHALESLLNKQNASLASCLTTVDGYRETTKELEALKVHSEKEVQRLKSTASSALEYLRQRPLENNLEAIRAQGLTTAKEAVKLWND